MIAAVIFVVSGLLAVFFILRSELNVAWRLGLVAATVIFAASAYVLATHSQISPFGASQEFRFGFWDNSAAVIVGIVGAVCGVVGSNLFKQGETRFQWSGLVKPLVVSPILIIPTIKLVEAAGEQTLLTVLLLFAVSYQNGFFWERVMKGGSKLSSQPE